jgi:hypothetical protein
MRFMMLLKSGEELQAGTTPGTELMVAMGKYNEALASAGVLLEAGGLLPSASGARVDFSGGMRTVSDGPFPDAGDQVAGFWMLQVTSKDEAIEWAKRCPHPHDGVHAQIEIRRVVEPAEFPIAPGS